MGDESRSERRREDFSPRQIQAVLDYVSRLEPPEELRATPGWRNPDFAH